MSAFSDQRFRGLVYRALNPLYARDPLSGRGAALHGGRFNAKGTEALYTALDPKTALFEANQVGDLQPTVLVSYRAEIGPIFDSRDTQSLKNRGASPELLADAGWRRAMIEAREVPTHNFARDLIADGYVGLLVRSYAKGSSDTDLNLVLWRSTDPGCSLTVIDDENRLKSAVPDKDEKPPSE